MKHKKALVIFLICIVSVGTFSIQSSFTNTVTAVNTAVETETGNIFVTIHTNKDVDQIVMNSGTGEYLITPHTEYSDEQLRGNNQLMDINGDHQVDQTDYDILKAHIDGSCKTFTAMVRCTHCGATDINSDGEINNQDLKLLGKHLENKCELDDCYFHGTRIHREEDPDNPSGYVWYLHFTPVIPGIDSITFEPQSVTSTGIREGEIKSLAIHAEEYKNPEILKTWVDPFQDKYLINKPVTLKAVTPLECDQVTFKTNGGEIRVDEWHSIDYDKNEKTWKTEYTPRARGYETYQVTGQGIQSTGFLDSQIVRLTDRIVEPLVINQNKSVKTNTYTWTTTSLDIDGNVITTPHTYTWYTITVTAITNVDADYVVFSTPHGDIPDMTYSSTGNTRVFSTSWDTPNGDENASALSHAIIGEKPAVNYQYQVIYDPQNGSQVPIATVAYDSLITAPAEPSRTGYHFMGWYKEARCINLWNFGVDRVRGTTMIYAKWEKNDHTVTFNSQGGSQNAARTVGFDSTINPPADPTKENYLFAGWYKDSGCLKEWDFGADRIYRDTELYAKWIPVTFKVSFNTRGGSAIDPIAVFYGSKLPDNLKITVLTGFNFDGWYLDSAYTIPWDLDKDVIDEPILLYAKWSEGEYTVNFDSMGGSEIPSQNIHYNQLASEPASVPIRKGYEFTGWYEDMEESNPWIFSINVINTPTTIYAGWKARIATIEFQTNGGSTISHRNGKTDQELSDQNMPETTRKGYIFKGWYDNSIFAGSPVTSLPDRFPSGLTTFYAKWQADDAQIVFIENGGSDVADRTGKTDGSISNRNFGETTREGYTLEGWYKSDDFSGSVITQLPEVFPADTTTYYAKWNGNRAYIQFNSGGNGYIPRLSGHTDEVIVSRTMPSVVSATQTFAGWYDNELLSGEPVTQLPATFPIGTLKLYAKWL